MNKPIYSLNIRCKDGEEDEGEFKEEVLSDAEEEAEMPDVDAKKIKKLRKRNKVNLKYLKKKNFWNRLRRSMKKSTPRMRTATSTNKTLSRTSMTLNMKGTVTWIDSTSLI